MPHLQEADVILTDGLHLQRGAFLRQLGQLCLQTAHQAPPLGHDSIHLLLDPTHYVSPDSLQGLGHLVQ